MIARNASAPRIQLVPSESPIEMQPIHSQHINFMQSLAPTHSRVTPLSPPQRTVTMRSNRSPDQTPAGVGDGRDTEKWQKLIQHIQYSPLSDSYYDFLPIKPGFFFLESLMEAPNAQLSTLRVNLPKTLFYSDKLAILYTSADGTVVCDREAHFITFLKLLEAGKPKTVSSAFEQVAVVLRMRAGKESEMKKYVFDWMMFRQKMLAHDMKQNTMLQEFIRSPGEKPAVIRLTYYVSTKNPRANFAYLISSRIHTIPHVSLLHRTVTDTSRPFAVDIFKQTGLSLKPFEAQARSVVDFLQRGYRIRLEEIVLDFLKSSDNVVYLCGCKGFRIDESTLPRELSPRREKAEERTKTGSFVTCKLCRLQFANHELPHLVSVKMLFLFRTHAMKRIKLPIETTHLKVTSTDFLSQSVRICACCFLVVTAEIALMTAERDLALALGIPVKDEDVAATKELSPQSQFLPKSLVQHRLLFHFTVLETGTTSHLRFPLFLHFQFDLISACYPLERVEDTGACQVYPINRMRLVYLFSAADKPMKKFTSEAVGEFSVTNERIPNSGKVFAKGKFPLLQIFPADLPINRALFAKQNISLFDPTGKQRFPLELGTGMSTDHLFDPSLLQVNLTKVMDAYIPEEHFFNSDPLPQDWLSVFGAETKEDSFGEDVNLEDAYGPLINREELDRMQDITSPYPAPLSNKLVVSRPKRSQSVALLPTKLRKTPTLSLAPTPDFSHFDRNTDSQVTELMSMVDNFLRPKGAMTTRAVPAIATDCIGKPRAASSLRTSRSTRIHSGKSSTRSATPIKDVKEVLNRQLKTIISLADKDMRLL